MITSGSWIYLCSLSLIWGSSFWLIKQGLESLSSLQVALLRIIIAGLCLLPFLFFNQKQKLPWLWLAIIGLVGNLIPALCFAVAQQTIPSALAGMTNSLQPILTMVLAYQFFNLSVQKKQVFGIGIGFLGALLLTAPAEFAQLEFTSSGATQYAATGLVVLATFCYALSTNLIRVYCATLPPVTIAATSINIYLIPALIIFLFTLPFEPVVNKSQLAHSLVSVFLLGSVGTAVALILFNRLVHRAGAVAASLVTYLIPIVAILIGLIDHEPIHLHQLIGMLVIFIGLWMLSRQQNFTPEIKSSN